VSKLSANGVAGFILANGALSADGTELAIRRRLIENGLVEAILILPRNLFYSTDISVTLWILNANKKARTALRNGETVNYRDREREILFMDLRQMGEPFEKKYVRLSDDDIAKIARTYHSWQVEGYEKVYRNEPEYCYSANIDDDVAPKGYSLVPSKYIEFANRDEVVDYDTQMKQLQSELSDILRQEERSRNELLDVFKTLGYELNL
jgi:type I restriction enzyme M protein